MIRICRAWFLVLGCVAFFVGHEARGEDRETPTSVSINATLAQDQETISGSVEFQITNNSGTVLSSIPIRLYPNRFREINPALDDRMIRWIYPGGESFGEMKIDSVSWNGASLQSSIKPFKEKGKTKDTIVNVLLLRPLGVGEVGKLRLDFTTKIPERRGRFGRWRGVVSLGGGWFPRPLSDLTGKDITLPPDTIRADARINLQGGLGAVLHDQFFPKIERKQTIEVADINVDVLVLVVMELMDVDKKVYDWGTVTHVHQELRNKKATWKDTRGGDGGYPPGLVDLGDVDISGRLFEIADNCVTVIKEVAPNAQLQDNLVFVDVPAWDRLVQPGPGPVLVSDRLWRVFPIDVGLWFHDLTLIRIVAAQLLRSGIEKKEPLGDRYLTTDTVGAFIASHYLKVVPNKGKSVEDMLGFASFLPTVDNILYAPQLPFREVYTRSVEEPDILRDEPWRSMNNSPRGKRIFGKLVDLLGTDGAIDLMVEYLGSDDYFDETLDKRLGPDSPTFKKQWFGDYPAVNYRLGKIEDIKKPGGVFLHRIEVIREGESIEEPVTVRIVDDDDEIKDITWDGKGNTGVVEWTSKAPIDSVQIDPEIRLVESPDLSEDHPLADNFDHLAWRVPMLSRFLVSGDITTGDMYAQVGFIMRRRYDITNAFAVNANYTPRSFGGNFGYLRFFGPKRTLNARTWYFGPYLGVTRYQEVNDAGLYLPQSALFAATAGSLKLVLGRDNRTYFFDPRSGFGFSTKLGYSFGSDDNGEAAQVGELESRYVAVYSPSIRHTFALSIGGMMVVGRPAAAQLATLSVREILKGFDIDETYGRLGLYSVLEHRFTIVDAAHVRAPAFWWFDRFQGVISVGGGTISDPGGSGYSGLFTKERLYSEVGCGLRIHFLALGVQQYIIALDLAVPITPFDREFEIEQSDGSIATHARDPFKIKFGIMQTF